MCMCVCGGVCVCDSLPLSQQVAFLFPTFFHSRALSTQVSEYMRYHDIIC